MNRVNKSEIIKIITLSSVTILYAIFTYIMFYRQCIGYEGNYISDMPDYVRTVKGIATDYEFPYPVMFMVARFFASFTTAEIGLAITVTVLNAGCIILLTRYMYSFLLKFYREENKSYNDLSVWGVSILFSIILLFVSMLYAPRGHGFLGFDYIYRCQGVYTPNPYWNATYLATRPFSIVAFFAGIRLLDTYEAKARIRDYFTFAVALLLTTLTKPSYTLVAVPVYGLIMLYRLVKARFKNIKNTILFGLTFLPAGLVCLYQFFGVFSGTNVKGEETGIAFGFLKAWHIHSRNIPLSIVMAAAFPIGVLLINLLRLKDTTWFRHAWQIFLSGLLMLMCLYEKGFRMEHMNFSWGYMHGLFFIFLVSIMMLYKNTIEKKSKIRACIVAVGWLGLLWHLVCGINFFLYMYMGECTGWF